MSSPEWYSGSDQSREVPSVIEKVSKLLEEDTVEVDAKHLEMLKRAIEIEQEPNWIAFLTGLVGMALETLGFSSEASEAYKSVTDFSRPDLPTFDDTLNVYCQVNYRYGKMLLEDARYEDALDAFLRVLPYMTLVFEDEHRCAVASFLDHCFSELGQPRFALPFAEAAAYYCPGDELTREFLAKGYIRNGLAWKAQDVQTSKSANGAEDHYGPSGGGR